jgi:hypothetical protein
MARRGLCRIFLGVGSVVVLGVAWLQSMVVSSSTNPNPWLRVKHDIHTIAYLNGHIFPPFRTYRIRCTSVTKTVLTKHDQSHK